MFLKRIINQTPLGSLLSQNLIVSLGQGRQTLLPSGSYTIDASQKDGQQTLSINYQSTDGLTSVIIRDDRTTLQVNGGEVYSDSEITVSLFRS